MKKRAYIIASIFCDSMRPLKLITILLYALCAFGLSLSDKRRSADLAFVFDAAPWWVWMLACAYVVVARFVGLFVWQGWWWTRRSTPIIGLTIWSMLFSASLHAPNFGMGLLYLVGCVIEAWLLARAFSEKALGI